jgi:hypothetical protein
MVRREFLKLAGMASAGMLVLSSTSFKAITLPMEVEARGKVYRGTQDGKILVSANGGKSWQLHSDFGSHLAVLYMSKDRGENVHAQMGFAGHSFELALAQNGNVWRTG